MGTIRAYAAKEARAPLRPFEYQAGPLGPGDVEVRVESCGICHSDLSMLDNEWGMSSYPLVPGHEAIGIVVAVGPEAKGVAVGQRVGIGWYAGSCMACMQCLSGQHNLCAAAEGTIVGRHGGFAERVRCHWTWAFPLPEGLDPQAAGPLFCGGITVFTPILEFGVRPVDRVGVIGVGGLGHLAIQFLRAWGCEVTAFSHSPAKEPEARTMGAHRFVVSRDREALKAETGRFDFILSTVNLPMEWDAYVQALAPRGRLHVVGALLEPMPVGAFSLITASRQISGSPVGNPAATRTMLEFCRRHSIAPVTETFPMSKVNDALEHVRSGKVRYRAVVTADF